MFDHRNFLGYKPALLRACLFVSEFNSQAEMFAQLQDGNVDRVLIPNYFDILRLTESEQAMKLFSVVDVIHEPFLTGLALANQDNTGNKAFVSCLRKKVKSLTKVGRSWHMGAQFLLKNVCDSSFFQPPSKDAVAYNNQDLHARTSMLFEHDILLIIYYNLLAIGVIAGIGMFLDLTRCFRYEHKRRKKSGDKEGKRVVL